MVDNTNRIAGTCYLSADGARLSLVGEFSYRPASPTREAKYGADGFHGYKEKPASGMIKAKLRDGGGVSVTALGQMTNVTVTAELANGKTIVGRNMFVTEQPSADAEEGEIEITWEGPDVSEN
jgi:hypothetical protein